MRHRAAVASWLSGGHEVWWLVSAADPEEALAHVHCFVAERSTVTEIREVQIP